MFSTNVITIFSLFQNAPNQEPVYRKVAIVENFFDIIYTVHVELEGRPGKHAGQKRTYRTVSLFCILFIITWLPPTEEH